VQYRIKEELGLSLKDKEYWSCLEYEHSIPVWCEVKARSNVANNDIWSAISNFNPEQFMLES